MKKRVLGRGLAVALALAFSLTLLTAAIYLPATADWVMQPLMERLAPPEDTRLPAEEYSPVVSMITRYLKGDDIPFQHVFTMDGTQYAAFHQKEQTHMADVQGLFHLCRMAGWICAGAAIALAVILRRDFPWRTFRRALTGILAAVALLGCLAVIDFDSLFILFHKVAFTNDLWLLNPQTDLLIRLMPLEFFISYAAIIGGLWLLGMAGLLIYATYRIKITKGE
ncbi:MAG: TIGR01906 family membrane protein [Clostridia bacterium]|nr:TIGR01906 family membrane protein [Clostridia bacterium]